MIAGANFRYCGRNCLERFFRRARVVFGCCRCALIDDEFSPCAGWELMPTSGDRIKGSDDGRLKGRGVEWLRMSRRSAYSGRADCDGEHLVGSTPVRLRRAEKIQHQQIKCRRLCSGSVKQASSIRLSVQRFPHNVCLFFSALARTALGKIGRYGNSLSIALAGQSIRLALRKP